MIGRLEYADPTGALHVATLDNDLSWSSANLDFAEALDTMFGPIRGGDPSLGWPAARQFYAAVERLGATVLDAPVHPSIPPGAVH